MSRRSATLRYAVFFGAPDSEQRRSGAGPVALWKRPQAAPGGIAITISGGAIAPEPRRSWLDGLLQPDAQAFAPCIRILSSPCFSMNSKDSLKSGRPTYARTVENATKKLDSLAHPSPISSRFALVRLLEA